jgi:predicted RNA binding protein YcfA (HicA-like mRNA interferase family)
VPALSPCSRHEFIRRLKSLGYDGPFQGGKDAFMTKVGAPTVRVPNPHKGDISIDLLRRILTNAAIDTQDWIKA